MYMYACGPLGYRSWAEPGGWPFLVAALLGDPELLE